MGIFWLTPSPYHKNTETHTLQARSLPLPSGSDHARRYDRSFSHREGITFGTFLSFGKKFAKIIISKKCLAFLKFYLNLENPKLYFLKYLIFRGKILKTPTGFQMPKVKVEPPYEKLFAWRPQMSVA